LGEYHSDGDEEDLIASQQSSKRGKHSESTLNGYVVYCCCGNAAKIFVDGNANKLHLSAHLFVFAVPLRHFYAQQVYFNHILLSWIFQLALGNHATTNFPREICPSILLTFQINLGAMPR
jgi:hypothetical protein